jgi:hypothetical protein
MIQGGVLKGERCERAGAQEQEAEGDCGDPFDGEG